VPRRVFESHDGHARSGDRTAASLRFALILDEAPLPTWLAATGHLGHWPGCGGRKPGCRPRSPSRLPVRPDGLIDLKTGVDCRAPGVYSNKAEQE
jgi:hypothetical protein